MKLIVAGATGFVGREIIRQSLKRPDITSVIALSRSPIPSPPQDKDDGSGNVSKLRNIVMKDYGEYPDVVRREFEGADACIWTVAITPSKSVTYDWEYVKHICQDCPVIALQAMHEAGANRPFRFVYMSGQAAERDRSKTPVPNFRPEYSWMRGEAENRLLKVAAESNGEIEVCAAKCGWITDNTFSTRSFMAFALKVAGLVPSLTVGEVAAGMIEQVKHGFEKEPLFSEDLVRIGRPAFEALT